jgi:hypothetical protein
VAGAGGAAAAAVVCGDPMSAVAASVSAGSSEYANCDVPGTSEGQCGDSRVQFPVN